MGSKINDRCKKIGEQTMNLLIERGVPYHEGIIYLVWDLEFHHRFQQGEILSSVKQANLYINTDVRFHSEAMNLSYELGKQIFHFWAETFHPEDYQRIVAEGGELDGTFMGIPKILQEFGKLKKMGPST
jgi:hypothetical protein